VEKHEVYLLLGCFGRTDDEFVSCAGCENIILNVDTHLENYNQMMDYFDGCRLFDRPLFEYSAIAHFIKNLQDKFDQIGAGKRLWSEKRYHLYQKFLSDHRLCGLYVKLALLPINDAANVGNVEEKSILIKSETYPSDPKFKLKLIRGKR
jgi:hypothetical protein